MNDVINLRKARKERQRRANEKIAAGNRLRFGRSKAQRGIAEALAEKEARRLDAARLSSPDQASDPE